jgi:hypothetical protein
VPETRKGQVAMIDERPCGRCRRRHGFVFDEPHDFAMISAEETRCVLLVSGMVGYIRRLETQTTEWWERA